jgi:hypothetical protein
MRLARSLAVPLLAVAVVATVGRPAAARSPRNPYSSFNLSGMNYGAMQWERAQRQGKRVWPYYNSPTPRYSRGGSVGTVGVGGGVIGGGTVRTAPRRWRR